jgi:hypothetical protein
VKLSRNYLEFIHDGYGLIYCSHLSGIHTDGDLRVSINGGTAEPSDKNRNLPAYPGVLKCYRWKIYENMKYGNYERGYPQILDGLVLKGFIW